MIDLTAMIINLSNALAPVQQLISGFGYLLGIMLVVAGLMEFKKHAESRGGQSSHENVLAALAYVVGGALLIYIPSTVSVLSNTVFGASNVLSYTSQAQPDVYHAMLTLIQTTGLIWFVRGMVLVTHSTQPGQKEGGKGMAFLFAGILAMNFESCLQALTYVSQQLFSAITHLKSNGVLLSLPS